MMRCAWTQRDSGTRTYDTAQASNGPCIDLNFSQFWM